MALLLCYLMLCYVMLCYIILYSVLLKHHIILYYDILYYIIVWPSEGAQEVAWPPDGGGAGEVQRRAQVRTEVIAVSIYMRN